MAILIAIINFLSFFKPATINAQTIINVESGQPCTTVQAAITAASAEYQQTGFLYFNWAHCSCSKAVKAFIKNHLSNC